MVHVQTKYYSTEVLLNFRTVWCDKLPNNFQGMMAKIIKGCIMFAFISWT